MEETHTENEQTEDESPKAEQKNEVTGNGSVKTDDLKPGNDNIEQKTRESKLKEIDTICKQIIEIDCKPLLVLYYSADDKGFIHRSNVSMIYDELYKGTNGKIIDELNVVIHTYGGDPDASYRIIQSIHELSNKVNIFVPYNSYSGGTLICLGANKILMGAYAALSPIDITITTQPSENEKYDELCGNEVDHIQLICIDKYVEFTKHCKNIIEKYECGEKITRLKTKIEEVLLEKFIDEVGAVNIANIFRERDSTRMYANILLKSYMFPDAESKKLVDDICEFLVYKSPSHTFQIDFNIAKNELKLNVERMETELSNKTKSLISLLNRLSRENIICWNITPNYKMPFVKYYNSGDLNESNEERIEPRNAEPNVSRSD